LESLVLTKYLAEEGNLPSANNELWKWFQTYSVTVE
jgi:hypothetical protein